MIPKIIHYCWFGRNEKPKLALKCINSWKRNCFDYKIIEWNEDNFDIRSAPLYVKQAYKAKKWAFVSDYVRLYALVNYGGVYMDTDVEVIKNLDPFLQNKAFSGFEDEKNIPTGIMACEKGFQLFDVFLHYYDNVSFLDENGTPSNITNVTIMTNICLQKGLIQNNQYQVVDGFVLYPNDYFCPLSYVTGKLRKTNNTHTIHWFTGSWKTEEEIKKHERYKRKEKVNRVKQKVRKLSFKLLGDRITNKIIETKRRKR